MRALVVSLLFVVPLLSGCLSGGDEDLGNDVSTLAVDQIHIPSGATLVDNATHTFLEWTDVDFPFKETIIVPEGATLIQVEGTLTEHADLGVSTYMKNAETGRRRCNPDYADTAWNVGHKGTHRCSGMTAIDPPGTKWEIRVTGPVDRDTGVSVPNIVRVHYDDAAPDGPVSLLDLSQLSMPEHTLKETDAFYLDSFDGTPLWVEVTLPEGEGPWPTVIAASPYNGQYGRLGQPDGEPAMWEYWTHDWAKRGYAAVNVDVRGFGLSDGCVEIWSMNEQLDQEFIVDWVADQDWSDGHVGFYGQSYVGTTPTAAAVHAPEALDAIIAVAPVINAYDDWHYGGVPNAENTLSPVAYQVLTDAPPLPNTGNPLATDPYPYTDPLTLAQNQAKGLCDATLIARANDPRAVYDSFYEERDFTLGVKDVTAAVLYTEGYEDANVKSAMIPGWFNEIESEKLGIFGHWVHQHPTRADEEVLFLGWMDQYVKGKDLGFEKLPDALIATNVETTRGADSFPTTGLDTVELWPDWAGGSLSGTESDASGATLTIAPENGNVLQVTLEVDQAFAITGTPHLNLRGTLRNGGNAFIGATLYDVHDGKRDLVTYGMYNLAHDETHTTWTAVTGASDVMLPFLPTEYVFQEGHKLQIDLYGVTDPLAFPGLGAPAGQFEIGAHPDGVGAFIADTVPMEAYEPMAWTAQP